MVRLHLPKHINLKRELITALQKLKEKLNYDSIETLQDEGCYPERVKIMERIIYKRR